MLASQGWRLFSSSPNTCLNTRGGSTVTQAMSSRPTRVQESAHVPESEEHPSSAACIGAISAPFPLTLKINSKFPYFQQVRKLAVYQYARKTE